jgi:hypothetical protein
MFSSCILSVTENARMTSSRIASSVCVIFLHEGIVYHLTSINLFVQRWCTVFCRPPEVLLPFIVRRIPFPGAFPHSKIWIPSIINEVIPYSCKQPPLSPLTLQAWAVYVFQVDRLALSSSRTHSQSFLSRCLLSSNRGIFLCILC